jgi:hypothetical protein
MRPFLLVLHVGHLCVRLLAQRRECRGDRGIGTDQLQGDQQSRLAHEAADDHTKCMMGEYWMWWQNCFLRFACCMFLTPLPTAAAAAAAAAAAVNKGDRIAQLVLECIVTPDVEVVEDLDDTSRGAGGFGSTGVAAKQ